MPGRAAILIPLVLAGCGPAQVQVLLDEPREPFQSIALVEAAGGDFPSLDRFTQRLRKEAARLGADAILIVGRAGKSGLLGRAIVFTRPPP